MSKAIRNLLLLAAVLIIVGGIIAGIGFAFGGMRSVALTKDGPVIMGSGKYETVQVDASYDKITEVVVKADIGDIKFMEGNSFSLKGSYDSSVQSLDLIEHNGVLTIAGKAYNNNFAGWLNTGFDFSLRNELTFTYPKGTEFKSVDLTLNLGDLEVRDLKAKSLEVNMSAGNFIGATISVDSLNANLNLGNCSISNLMVTKTASIVMDLGNLHLSDSSVNDLTAKNNMGNIEYFGMLTGNAKVTLDLGSLTLRLDSPENKLSYTINSNLGSVEVNGQNRGLAVSKTVTSPVCTLDISLAMGSANITTR